MTELAATRRTKRPQDLDRTAQLLATQPAAVRRRRQVEPLPNAVWPDETGDNGQVRFDRESQG